MKLSKKVWEKLQNKVETPQEGSVDSQTNPIMYWTYDYFRVVLNRMSEPLGCRLDTTPVKLLIESWGKLKSRIAAYSIQNSTIMEIRLASECRLSVRSV